MFSTAVVMVVQQQEDSGLEDPEQIPGSGGCSPTLRPVPVLEPLHKEVPL